MTKQAKTATTTTTPNDRAQAAFALGAIKEALWRLETVVGRLEEETHPHSSPALCRMLYENGKEAFNVAIDVIQDLERNGWEIDAPASAPAKDAYEAMQESHRKRGEAKIMDAFERPQSKNGDDQPAAALN